MKIPDLRRFTPARVSLGRTGNALPTTELLRLRLSEIRAREAVHASLNAEQLAQDLAAVTNDLLIAESAAPDRASYVRRPDWGRRLNEESRGRMLGRKGSYDVVFIVADGLSVAAVVSHSKPLLERLLPMLAPEWRIAPLVIVKQGRVAISDEIGEDLGAALSVLLIGERPGLSASDSLGVYLTWNPRRGLTDADRNCLSNIRNEGLQYDIAASRLAFLINESARRKLSGVNLKEDLGRPALADS